MHIENILIGEKTKEISYWQKYVLFKERLNRQILLYFDYIVLLFFLYLHRVGKTFPFSYCLCSKVFH